MKRIHGITYLKAFLPLLVITCHIRPFGESSFMTLPLPTFPDFKDIFYINISAVAVPVFFLITFYLYLYKRQQQNVTPKKLILSRVRYFLILFLTVRTLYLFLNIGNLWINERGLARNLYHLLFGGGDTLLYYLELSIYFLIFLEIYYTLADKLKWNKKATSIAGLAVSILLIIVLSFFSPYVALKIEALRYFSPVAFLPYIFMASILHESDGVIKNKYLFIMLLLSAIFFVIEWKYLPDKAFLESGYSLAMPLYAKVSTVLLSVSVFGFALKIKKCPAKIIGYASGLSLWVYCIHQVIINLLTDININSFLMYCAVTVITYIISIIIFELTKKLKQLNNK